MFKFVRRANEITKFKQFLRYINFYVQISIRVFTGIVDF